MRFSPFGVVAAFAVAEAFLLPPEISAADTDIIKTLPFEDAVAIDGRVMEINCPGCPVVTDIENKMHSTQVDSMLQLNFTVVHDGLDRLFLNGLQIYPMDPQSVISGEPLTASQMIKNADNTWEYSSTPRLGYTLSVRHPMASSSQDQLDLVSIHVEIVEVADQFISGLPIIEMQLLETPSHNLMIGDAKIITMTSTKAKPSEDTKECTTLLCKWRAIVADRFRKLKGCSKSRPAVEVAMHKGHKSHKGQGHHGRPHTHHGGPNRPYRHHHRHGGFSHFLKGIVVHVLIPVLIGIMVGITASLVGMVFGQTVVFIWRMLFRRGERGQYAKVQQEEIIVEDVADESKGFLEHHGPPPVYEEVVIVEEKPSE